MFVFFNDSATTYIYTYLHTLSLHDALPIFRRAWERRKTVELNMCELLGGQHSFGGGCQHQTGEDRVTADPAPSILGRNIKGKAIHSRLGSAIGGAEAVSEQGFNRTGVDDQTGLGFKHLGQDMVPTKHRPPRG